MYFLLLFSVSLSSAAANWLYMSVSLNITAVPTDIPSTVREIHLTDNLIEDIPADMFSHLSLQTLRLGHNLLSKFPDLKSVAQSLQYLYLDNNRITVIDSQRLNNLTRLRKLSLHNNAVHALPDITIPNLRTFGCNNCSLAEFPNIENCALVEYLNLAANDINIIPDNYFMSMSMLKVLGINGNPRLTGLITLPVGSSQIKQVYASRTSITEIPAQAMASMDKLTVIQLTNVSDVLFSYCAIQ